jgi:Ribbon-helix-helix protein, copG family
VSTRARTLRLPAEQAEELEAIADIDEVSVNEEIRQAIESHIETRRQDADFKRRLEASIARNKEILVRLSR